MFKRIANLFRGFIGLFVSGMEKRAPEALLEVEKENLRKQIAKYNQGLAAHAGLCENLMSQIPSVRDIVKNRAWHDRRLGHARSVDQAIAPAPRAQLSTYHTPHVPRSDTPACLISHVFGHHAP